MWNVSVSNTSQKLLQNMNWYQWLKLCQREMRITFKVRSFIYFFFLFFLRRFHNMFRSFRFCCGFGGFLTRFRRFVLSGNFLISLKIFIDNWWSFLYTASTEKFQNMHTAQCILHTVNCIYKILNGHYVQSVHNSLHKKHSAVSQVKILSILSTFKKDFKTNYYKYQSTCNLQLDEFHCKYVLETEQLSFEVQP